MTSASGFVCLFGGIPGSVQGLLLLVLYSGTTFSKLGGVCGVPKIEPSLIVCKADIISVLVRFGDSKVQSAMCLIHRF